MADLSNTTLQTEYLDTDVLVIGAGAGGMMAAITAADGKADVILCELGNARRSGGLMGGNDHFWCWIPHIHGKEMRQDFINAGRKATYFLDEDFIPRHVDLCYDVVQKWESWGVDMKTDGHCEFSGHGMPGSTGKMGEPGNTTRKFIHFSDHKLSVKLEKQCRKRGVRIMNRVALIEFLKDGDGRVVGAAGISTREPKMYIFRAKGIVINTGGVNGERLYPPPHIIGYSMARPGAGDGEMMAFRAGAELQNCEFFTRQISMRFGPWSGKNTWVGIVTDAEGKPIAPPYLTEPDVDSGIPDLNNAEANDHAWAIGKGPVWVDPRGITEQDEQYMRWACDSEAMQPVLRWMDRENIPIRKTRFEFVGMQPAISMQIRVDQNLKTRVDGLYAILRKGLCANAGGLSVSAVGGQITGESAARDAKGLDHADLECQKDKIATLKARCEEILRREGPQYADWREAQWAVWQIMHTYALPPKRTENTLMAGYNQLCRVRKKFHEMLKAANQRDLYHCFELMNLMDATEVVLLSVNERKESRFTAKRMDYPFTNPMLEKFLIVSRKDGKPAFRWEKPRTISGTN